MTPGVHIDRRGLFTAPTERGLALFRLEGFKTRNVATISDDRSALAGLCPDGGLVAVVDDEGRRLRWWDVGRDGVSASTRGDYLTIPEGGRAHAVLVVGDTAFVGGATERGESLWFVEAGANEWGNASFGDTEQWPRKAIDALVCEGRRLVAVDDVVLPKYLFEFDVTTPGRPTLTGEAAMSGPVTWETVRSAALGGGWLALLSYGMSRRGGSTALCLHHWEALDVVEETWVWQEPHSRELSGMLGMTPRPLQLIIVGQWLYAACGGAGIAEMRLYPSCVPDRGSQPRRNDERVSNYSPFGWRKVRGARNVRSLTMPVGVTDRLVLVGEREDGAAVLTPVSLGPDGGVLES